MDLKKDYSVEFRNKDYELQNNVQYTWNIIANFDVQKSIRENTITLLIDNENCIGSSFLLQVIVDGIVLSEMQINVIEAF